MNKGQLLQAYADLYERNKKLSKSQHNKLIWGLKYLSKLESELANLNLNSIRESSTIKIKTKTKANNDYENQLRTIKNQCGYTYDLFNFCTLLKNKPKKINKAVEKNDKPIKVIKKPKEKTLTQALSEQLKLETIRKASN